jgi:uncharacterized protein (TIGR02145 family)
MKKLITKVSLMAFIFLCLLVLYGCEKETVPGAPTAVSATAGNALAIVTFTSPSSDGGSAITGYTVTSSPGSITGTGAASPINVIGLANGTPYTFKVTATNAIGTGPASSASNSVTPSTGPDAPTNVTATAGNAQATVTFTAPVNNGGSAITGYTVTSNPGSITVMGTASPITVTGLTNGTAYIFNVTATNINGNGPPSASSNLVIPSTVPDAPTNVVATAGNAQIIVTFTAPVNNGGSAITGYTVTSSPGGFTATGSASPLTVTGLINGTTYTFSVVATNINGNSVPSSASNSIALVSTVTNPTTGKIWMDRNLGASRVATSSTDEASYGDLYQWGRGTDGHQVRTSGTTSTLSTSDTPGHGNFILNHAGVIDWRSPHNDNLWQGVNGINNPCPNGYRLPTEAEWNAESLSWSSGNSAGAFASPLKLTLAGSRGSREGSVGYMGMYGSYWSSTVVYNLRSWALQINIDYALLGWQERAYGYSVRCIKD